jgi:hypothetical protein
MNKLLALCLLLALAISCNSNQARKSGASPADQALQNPKTTLAKGAVNKEPRVQVAAGGGFTGRRKNISLSESGSLWMVDTRTKDSAEVNFIPRDTLISVYKEARLESLPEQTMNIPGNITLSLQYFNGDSLKTWSWGKPEIPPPQSLHHAHQTIMQRVSELYNRYRPRNP